MLYLQVQLLSAAKASVPTGAAKSLAVSCQKPSALFVMLSLVLISFLL
jgi:hypothetical protein